MKCKWRECTCEAKSLRKTATECACGGQIIESRWQRWKGQVGGGEDREERQMGVCEDHKTILCLLLLL